MKERLKKTLQSRAMKNGAYASAMCALMVVLVVVLNLFIGALPERYTQLDLTDSGVYSLSDETKKLCESVDEDITLYYLARTGGEDSRTLSLLQQYADLSSHIKVVQKDPVLYPTFGNQYEASDASLGSVIVYGGDRYRVVDYTDLYQQTINYETYQYETSFDGEGQITSAIAYVSSEDLPKLYIVQGHGESRISSTLSSGLTRQNMETDTLNLLTVDAVPEDADVLLIHAPTKDLSDDEAAKVTSYLENGGTLMLVTNYGEYSAAEMPNLTAIAAAYGLSAQEGIVIEGDSSAHLNQYPYYILPTVLSHDITEPLLEEGSNVLVPLAHGIAIAETLPENVTAQALLTSSSQAYCKTDAYESNSLEKEDGDLDGPFDLAAVAENSETGARFIWLPTSYLLDADTDSLVSGANSDLVLNCFAWLADSKQSISIHAKDLSMSTITVQSDVANLLGLGITILLPAVLIGIGVGVWLKRRKR